MLTIALSKGRILNETLPLLAKADVLPTCDPFSSRKLIIPTNNNVRLLIVRATDVPTYVEQGAADIGIAGKDVLLEYGGQIYQPLDLKIARCKMMTAAKIGAQHKVNTRLKVATKFINIAKNYYAEQGMQVDIIKLYGSMELAPLVGLADEIVDVVDTGQTLHANGLEPRNLICNISAKLIVGQTAMRIKHSSIKNLIDKLRVIINS